MCSNELLQPNLRTPFGAVPSLQSNGRCCQTNTDNGFLELDNNTCEHAMKPVAIRRNNWMFAGSERGGKAMAIAFTLIETAKLNVVDPQAWLTDVLSRIAITRSLNWTS